MSAHELRAHPTDPRWTRLRAYAAAQDRRLTPDITAGSFRNAVLAGQAEAVALAARETARLRGRTS